MLPDGQSAMPLTRDGLLAAQCMPDGERPTIVL
jgi:hypothetical protein